MRFPFAYLHLFWTLIGMGQFNHLGFNVMNSRVMLYIGEETITFVQADLCGVQFVSQQVQFSQYDYVEYGPNAFPSLLFNAMIHPLVGLGMKGQLLL